MEDVEFSKEFFYLNEGNRVPEDEKSVDKPD
jgi:hypothetical protein